jgi:hypothetical protein
MTELINTLSKAKILQAIRTRFTSGRPRKFPVDMLGPMLCVQTAQIERDRIRDFIREQGEDADQFTVKVFVVTLAPTGRQRTWDVPEDLDGIITRADELKKYEDLKYLGMLVTVQDIQCSAVVRYTRPFIVSQEASEGLATAAIKERFGKVR